MQALYRSMGDFHWLCSGKNFEDSSLQKRIRDKLILFEVQMNMVAFTLENYQRLFPNSEVETPLGVVKMGANQFKKLEVRKREYLLGGVF